MQQNNAQIKDNLVNVDVIEEKIKGAGNEIKIRKYTKGKFLGKGGFAHCYEFICQDNGKIFAAKIINKENIGSPSSRQKLYSEIKIHKSLHHNQIVTFEHSFEDDKNLYMLLELCQNQTLEELQRRRETLTELEIQCYIIQLIKGLQYLHSHKIIHRDLKLGNLFLTDKMELKIGDFGLATKLDYEGEIKKTVCGTRTYMAPEILSGEYSYEVDIWSVAIIIYALFVGKTPFELDVPHKGDRISLIEKNIKSLKYRFPEECKMSYVAQRLIRKILVKNRAERPTYEDILLDDFFSQNSAIPKLLPSSTLVEAPNLEYIKRFMPNIDENGICHLHPKEQKEDEERRRKEEEERIKKEEEEKKRREEAMRKMRQRRNAGGEKKEETSKTEEKKEETPKTEEKKDDLPTKEELSTKDGSEINPAPGLPAPPPEKLKDIDLYVTKWVDYSSKYGLGYLLSNKLIGVYFNDCTKLIYNPRTSKISFVERKVSEKKDMLYTFGLSEAPKELGKKILIFQQFKKYFEEILNEEKKKKEENDKEKKDKDKPKTKKKKTEKKEEKKEDEKKEEKEGDSVFVRKWMKTNLAIIFRLSNKTIQVIFKDHSEILLLNDIVTYKDKNQGIRTYTIDEAINSSNFEMNKRIEYAQNIFTKIINNNSKKN